jgi:fructose-1,6-bisphosphatase/inositol monophosphatase family enzyme
MSRGGPPSEPRGLLDARALTRLAQRAGAIALERRREASTELPEEVAARIEEKIVEMLPARASSLLVVSERSGRSAADLEKSRAALVVSALDGADAWAAGVPTWSVALALVENGETTAATVYVPAADDLYVAHGGVLRWNGEVVPEGGLEPTRTGFVLALADLTRRSPLRLRRRHPLGSPAYHLALVARGGADGALLDRPRLCDVAPGLALLGATGGEAIDLASGRTVGLGAWLDSRPPRRLLVARHGASGEILQRMRRA